MNLAIIAQCLVAVQSATQPMLNGCCCMALENFITYPGKSFYLLVQTLAASKIHFGAVTFVGKTYNPFSGTAIFFSYYIGEVRKGSS